MKELRRHPFTLIEVLVAVAVLVIMMGFIFQFTGSAQKLWASNTGRTEMSAQADAVFSLLQEDLEHLYLALEEEDLDAQAGWYIRHEKPGDPTIASLFSASADRPLKDLCFFTQDTAPQSPAIQAAIYPVRYHFVPGTPGEIYGEGTGKLYRYVESGVHWEKISEEFEDAGKGDTPDWYAPEPAAEADKEEYLLAENIQSITVLSDAARDEDGNPRTANPLRVRPRFLRVTITFSIPETLRNGARRTENTDMTFSRVFLLNK